MLLAFPLSQSDARLQETLPLQPIERCLVLQIRDWESRLSNLGVAHLLFSIFIVVFLALAV